MNASKQNTALPTTSEEIKYQVIEAKNSASGGMRFSAIAIVMCLFITYSLYKSNPNDSGITVVSGIGFLAIVSFFWHFYLLSKANNLAEEVLRANELKKAEAAASSTQGTNP